METRNITLSNGKELVVTIIKQEDGQIFVDADKDLTEEEAEELCCLTF